MTKIKDDPSLSGLDHLFGHFPTLPINQGPPFPCPSAVTMGVDVSGPESTEDLSQRKCRHCVMNHQRQARTCSSLDSSFQDFRLIPSLVRDVSVEPDLNSNQQVLVLQQRVCAKLAFEAIHMVALAAGTKLGTGTTSGCKTVSREVEEGENLGSQ